VVRVRRGPHQFNRLSRKRTEVARCHGRVVNDRCRALDNVAAVATWRRAVLLTSSVCDLAAGAVIALWVVSGYFAGGPFVLLFGAAGVLLIAAVFRNSIRALVIALVLTLVAELEPLGGVTASALQRAPIPWLGSVLPLFAGALSIVGMAVALVSWRASSDTRKP
jgi:hypothetical protein